MAPRAPAPSKRRQQPRRAAKASVLAANKDMHRVQKQDNGLLKLQSTTRNLGIARRNQAKSPLLRLPAEIRNEIFEFVLGGNDLTVFDEYNFSRATCMRDFGHKKGLALLSVCRQIYTETAVLPFRLNRFCLLWPYDADRLAQILLWGQREAIKAFRIPREVADVVILKEELLKTCQKMVGNETRVEGCFEDMQLYPSLKHVFLSREGKDTNFNPDSKIESIIRQEAVDKELKIFFQKDVGSNTYETPIYVSDE